MALGTRAKGMLDATSALAACVVGGDPRNVSHADTAQIWALGTLTAGGRVLRFNGLIDGRDARL